jgi:hypothetical protein
LLQRRSRAGECLWCGESGHMWRDCEKSVNRPDPKSAPYPTPAPEPDGESAGGRGGEKGKGNDKGSGKTGR